jgi:hypothetical protein
MRVASLGATGLGATGLGATGLGATGLGATGLGETSLEGTTGLGETSLEGTGLGVAVSRAWQLGVRSEISRPLELRSAFGYFAARAELLGLIEESLTAKQKSTKR